MKFRDAGAFWKSVKKNLSSIGYRSIFLLLLVPVTALQAQVVVLPTDPRIPVITYEKTPADARDIESTSSIQMYANGQVKIEYGDPEDPSEQFELTLTAKQTKYLVNVMLLPMLVAPTDILQHEIDAVRDYVRQRGELVTGAGSRGLRIKLDTLVNKKGLTKNNYRHYFLWRDYHAKPSTLARVKSRAKQLWRFARLEQTLRAIAAGNPAPELEAATGQLLAKPKRVLPAISGQVAWR